MNNLGLTTINSDIILYILFMFSEPIKNIEQFSVDPGMKVADLGSGSGFYTLALSKAVGDTGTVFSIDVQQELLTKLKNESVRQNLENINIILGDIENINGTTIANNTVDRAIIANTLFQTTDKEGVIGEAKRILKPKGMLLIVDWSDSFGGLGPTGYHLFKESQAMAVADKVGLEFVRKIEAGDHHYGLIFRKS